MRLFIAIPLEDKVETALGNIINDLRKTDARVKWVDPKNIHLTLKFLGDTDEQLVAPISKALENISRKYQPMKVVIDTIGAFPNKNKPRVVWAGMSEQVEALAYLADDIDKEMTKLGFEPETKIFKSHLTLGRLKDPRQSADLPDLLQNFKINAIEIAFNTIVLLESQLTPRGPIYTRIFETKLKSNQIFG